jgi:hypothetical protein
MARRARKTNQAEAKAVEAKAVEAVPEPPAEAGAGDPHGDPRQADASALVEALRVDLLQRMTAIVQALPPGYYTEVKGMIAGADGAPLAATYKLRDFAASLKDLAAIGKGLGGPDIEDMGPVMSLVYGDDDEDNQDGDD